MTPVKNARSSLAQTAPLEGTRLARLRLQELGRFQERETEGSVQVCPCPKAHLGDALVQALMLNMTLSLQALYAPCPPAFAVLGVQEEAPDQRAWSAVAHDIAPHGCGLAGRCDPSNREASAVFAEAVEGSVVTLDDGRGLPKDCRHRPQALKSVTSATPALTVVARIPPLDPTVSRTATFALAAGALSGAISAPCGSLGCLSG